MSKELEALKQIKASHLQAHIVSGNIGSFDIWFGDYYKLLEQTIIPPTKEELCDLLSKQLKSTIVTRKNKHGVTFNYAETGKTIISRNYENLNIRVQLAPELFEVIGRFYRGEIK